LNEIEIACNQFGDAFKKKLEIINISFAGRQMNAMQKHLVAVVDFPDVSLLIFRLNGSGSLVAANALIIVITFPSPSPCPE
jgi:hypothetical protein